MNATIGSLKTELCYHVEVDGAFDDEKIAILQWILKEPQQIDMLSRKSVWDSAATNDTEFIIEIGPRFVLANTHLLIIIAMPFESIQTFTDKKRFA